VASGVRVVFVGKDRPVGREVAFALLTLGIHRRVWLYRANREVDGHEALGLRHWANAALLVLPVLGPAIVQWLTAKRVARMLAGSPVHYGPPRWVALAGLLPLVGTILFFLPWTQVRLNRFWAHERARQGTGVEVDVDVGSDPRFLVEMGRALKESYVAGSRFEAKRRAKERAWAAKVARFERLRAERRAVRDAGGSVPLVPWRMPRRPPVRLLHVTCGQCQWRFDVRRDPAADTPVVCPKCGLAEVLPSLHSDPLRGAVPAAIPRLAVDCPKCKGRFHAVHDLHHPTELRCPHCGHAETMAPPAPQRRRKADPPVATRT
jgi:DNA-directed RNA polymerase subunit RPC12/RpoP